MFGVGVVLFSVAVCHWNQRLVCKHSVTVLDRCVSPDTHTHEVQNKPLTILLQERVEVGLAVVADPAAPAAPVLGEGGGEHAWPVQ